MLGKCCCCVDLYFGVKVLGFFLMTWASLSCLVALVFGNILLAASSAIETAIHALLVLGSIRKEHIYLVAWLILITPSIVANAVIGIWIILSSVHDQSELSIGVTLLVAAAIWTYFWVVVLSLVYKWQSQQRHPDAEEALAGTSAPAAADYGSHQ